MTKSSGLGYRHREKKKSRIFLYSSYLHSRFKYFCACSFHFYLKSRNRFLFKHSGCPCPDVMQNSSATFCWWRHYRRAWTPLAGNLRSIFSRTCREKHRNFSCACVAFLLPGTLFEDLERQKNNLWSTCIIKSYFNWFESNMKVCRKCWIFCLVFGFS